MCGEMGLCFCLCFFFWSFLHCLSLFHHTSLLSSSFFSFFLSQHRCEECPRAALADILRVHEYRYVKQIKTRCEAVEEGKVSLLDDDTAVSANSFEAAMHAAGAVMGWMSVSSLRCLSLSLCIVLHHLSILSIYPSNLSHTYLISLYI